MRRIDDRTAILGLLLVVALLFAKALFGDYVFFWRDIHSVWYPRIETMVRAVSQGSWPLWDPHVGFGLPALADPSYQLAYPLTWLNLVMPPTAYYTLFAVVHTLGAGLGLFYLARRWGMSSASAFVASAGWMASGPLLSWVNLFHHFAGLAWMPWVLLALEAALERGTPGSALRLGAVAAGQILAGSGDMCLMTAIIGLSRVGGFALSRRSEGAGALARVLRTGAIAALFALLLGAVQWLPTVELMPQGARLALSASSQTHWSLHPVGLLDLMFPNLAVVFPINAAARAGIWGAGEPFLVSLYWGMGLLFLTGFGALLGRSPRRGLMISLGLLFVVCALGHHTPVYSILSQLPPFSILRYPVKYLAAASLCAALLAGMGFDAWLDRWGSRETRRAGVLAAVFIGLGIAAGAGAQWVQSRPGDLAWLVWEGAGLSGTVHALRAAACLAVVVGALVWIRRRWQALRPAVTVAMVGLAVGHPVWVGRETNGLILAPEVFARYKPAWARDLTTTTAPLRLYAVPLPPDLLATVTPAPGWKPEWLWTVGVIETLAPPIGARWAFDGSYDGDLTGLTPTALRVLSGVLHRARGTTFALRLLQMGAVDYVTSVEEQPWLGEPVREAPLVLDKRLRVYRVSDPLPRAYVVEGVRVISEPESYALLWDPGLDVRREVLLAEGSPRPAAPGFSGTATLLWRRADALALEVDLNRAGYAVVVDGFDPGWTATVDGAPVRVSRANILFRAVPVRPGRHLVEMRYRPASARWGAGLTLAGAVLGLAAAWAGRRPSVALNAAPPPG